MRLPLPTSALARDILGAAVLTVATQIELVLVAGEVEGVRVLQHLAFALMTAPVAARRRAPVLAAVASAAGLAAQTMIGDAPVVGGFLALLVVTASVGYHPPARLGLLGLAAMGVAGLVYPAVRGEARFGDEVGNLAIFAGVWALARAARVDADRAVAAEISRERHAREAVGAERRRIARDLHDSAAHAITVITLQAGGARQLSTDPTVTSALQAVEHAGRQALDDMHRLLGLLRAEGDTSPDHHGGTLGLADLDRLAGHTHAAGLAVELTLTGESELPASVGATVYRLVQEGLTNALRHGGARRAQVAVAVSADRVDVSVSDDGTGRPAASGGGYGLAGLRERVALFDGTFDAGPAPTGGWRLAASLPLPGVATVAA